jgi:putative DNA primase/helicase
MTYSPEINAVLDELGGPADEAVQNGSGTDAELIRLAKLPLVEYEQQRLGAAKQLNVRASILDRLVGAERAKLGLDADDSKQGHAIAFPEIEPWPHEIDGAALLDELADAIRRHVSMSDVARDATALWLLHAYLFDRFLVSPRLGVTSPVKGCGKTTLLDVLARLVPRPLPTANVTPAALFRVVEGYQPTLLVDEADTFLHDNDELRGVLNSGHRKGGAVLRTVGDDHEPRAFSTYCPTAIALIGNLPDTLHDRSVHIELKRRLRSEPIEPYRSDRADHLDVLARKAVRWAKDHGERIAATDPRMPDNVVNRAADNWRPLLAAAQVAGGEWPERARKAALAAHNAAVGDEASWVELLLGDIRHTFGEQTGMSSAELVKVLVEIEGRPWAELGRTRKPLTQNRLAQMLRPLAITSENIRIGDKVLKGYLRERFSEAFERYLRQDGASEPLHRYKADEMGTSYPFPTATHEPDVAVRKCEMSNNDGSCSGVAVKKGGRADKGDARANGWGGKAERGLSEYEIKTYAEWVEDRHHELLRAGTPGDEAEARVNGELRQWLGQTCFPESIEIEASRIWDEIFRPRSNGHEH